MLTLEHIPAEFHTDHLLLLVGANPLPNYVAARLLTKPTSKVHLLHTGATGDVAENLRGVISNELPGVAVEFWQIDTVDSTLIRQRVTRIVATIGRSATVGLNYTGGTKSMAVHVYRALEETKRQIVFSYLDAQTLSLQFDGRDGEPTRVVHVRQKCAVRLDELAQLHGYIRFQKQPVRAVGTNDREKVIEALLAVHLTDDGFTQWRKYGESKFEQLPQRNAFPALIPLLDVVEELCGIHATPQDFAQRLGPKDQLKSYSKWLIGEWLEEYVLMRVKRLSTQIALHDYGMGVEPVQRNATSNRFELDIAAMLGYQLFAISCMAAVPTGKAAYKEHLLEAYVRARQLGGDEARVGLVCFYANAAQLEAELQETWLTQDAIRVFGCSHLPDLDIHLRDWFESANLP